MAQTRNITLAKAIVSHIFTLSLAGGLTVTFNGNSPVVGELGKNITMQWSINLTERSNIEFIKAYVQLQSNKKTQIVSWDVGKPVVSSDGEKNYGNRLITYLNNSKFTLTITNVQYNDSRNYSMSVISKPPLTEAADTVTVYVYGRPEMCIGNNTNGSQLTYTVCGVPMPKVTWGFTKSSINKSINATERNDLFYAYDYSLSLKPNMCEKVLYFDAVGYKNITISWSEKVKKDCDDPSPEASSKTIIVVLVVIVILFVLIAVIAAYVYWRKMFCFKRKEHQDGSKFSKHKEEVENLNEAA